MAAKTARIQGEAHYEVHGFIGRGGMASVFLGRLVSARGFARLVALKQLHQGADNAKLFSQLLDEARLTSRVKHPAIVNVTDVAESNGLLYLVMDHVLGETLGDLLQTSTQLKRLLSPSVVVTVIGQVLRGLHAAHEAVDARGNNLELVHRDVTPQNIIVGVDGFSRLLDFGIARARGRTHQTQGGVVKGKLAYIAPEYVAGLKVDRRGDVFSAGVVAWEAFCGRRLYGAVGQEQLFREVMQAKFGAPSHLVPSLPSALDGVLAKALAREPSNRFRSALDFVQALEAVVPPAPPESVALLVTLLAKDTIAKRVEAIREVEQQPLVHSETAEIDIPRSDFYGVEPPTIAARIGKSPSGEGTLFPHEPTLSSDFPVERFATDKEAPLASRWLRARPLLLAALVGAVVALVIGAFLQPKPPPPPFRMVMPDGTQVVPTQP
jgi:eukaryotic-like serine/threonine-protein kinase